MAVNIKTQKGTGESRRTRRWERKSDKDAMTMMLMKATTMMMIMLWRRPALSNDTAKPLFEKFETGTKNKEKVGRTSVVQLHTLLIKSKMSVSVVDSALEDELRRLQRTHEKALRAAQRQEDTRRVRLHQQVHIIVSLKSHTRMKMIVEKKDFCWCCVVVVVVVVVIVVFTHSRFMNLFVFLFSLMISFILQ